jgi:hypothetical protein
VRLRDRTNAEIQTHQLIEQVAGLALRKVVMRNERGPNYPLRTPAGTPPTSAPNNAWRRCSVTGIKRAGEAVKRIKHKLHLEAVSRLSQ